MWKIAEATCVFKDGDAGNPCDNQPISLLLVLSKVNERLAHRQFVMFLEDNNKLGQFQSSNHKHHSTETALLSVTDDLHCMKSYGWKENLNIGVDGHVKSLWQYKPQHVVRSI